MPPAAMLQGDRRRQTVEQVANAGLHFQVGDHVSFRGGHGHDALIDATSLLSLRPDVRVCVSIYLLPLRHPVLVSRQLASIAQIAPGRLAFGTGIGGEDRHEVEVCGVDPRTRGRRMDECLEVIRALAGGTEVTHEGSFFQFEEAQIVPAPDPPVPLLVGGRSDAAVSRVARYGDGWVALWVSAARFAAAAAEIEEQAGDHGRDVTAWSHALNVWCGIGSSREAARAALATPMEAFYGMPFERFERWSPYGTPEQVAEFLAPYVEAGCRTFNLTPCGPEEELIGGVAEVARLLAR